jgi:hypothetical protein
LGACNTVTGSGPSTPQTSHIPIVANGPCAIKPSATNTGPAGDLHDSPITVVKDGQTIEDARVGRLEIRGRAVTVRNVEATGNILVTGDGALIDHVSAAGIAISSASGTTVQYADIGNGAGDGIHITSDRGRLVQNVVLKYNFVHSPRVPDDAHYDGTQVRGVEGLVISCSTYDPGAYRNTFNAAIYVEDANGGASDVIIEHNWLYGFGFSIMIGANGTRIIGNRVGGDIKWGSCDLEGASFSSLEIRDNVNDKTNTPEPMCSFASTR